MTKSVIAGADSVPRPPLTPDGSGTGVRTCTCAGQDAPDAVHGRRHRRGVRLARAVLAVEHRRDGDCRAGQSARRGGPPPRPADVCDRLPGGDQVEAYSVIRGIVESGRGPGGSASAPVGHPAVHRGGERPEQLRLQPGSGAGGDEAAEPDRRDRGQRRRASGHVQGRTLRAGPDDRQDPAAARLRRRHQHQSADGLSAVAGPSFEAFDARPFLFGTERRLLEVPCTLGFAGFARRAGLPLHRAAESEACCAASRRPGS